MMVAGLPCGSTTSLKSGSSYNISSKVCSNGLYPNAAYCNWFFDVNDCIPSISCDKLDIMGNPRRRLVAFCYLVFNIGSLDAVETDWLWRLRMTIQNTCVDLIRLILNSPQGEVSAK